MYDLIRLPVSRIHKPYWVFNRNPVCVCREKPHKKTALLPRSAHLYTTFSAGVHRREKLRVATFDRYVHGGCAMSKSHLPTSCVTPSIVVTLPPSMAINASPNMCHSVCPPDGSCTSQLYASCPLARNAMHTACDSSQAISTLIVSSLHSSAFPAAPASVSGCSAHSHRS